MGKKSFLIVLFCLGLAVNVFSQSGLRINEREVAEGEAINLFHSDLDAGKITFSLSARDISKAEITFDKGRNWEAMEKEAEAFVFSYRPMSDEVIVAEFLITREDGGMNTYKPYVRINYQKKNPEESLRQILEKMKDYYEQERKGRFMSLFSSAYPDRVKFEQAIQNDFYNYNNLRLRYRIDRRSFDSDYSGAIWDVYWERKYNDRSGNSYSDSATISMRFDKEGSGWLISGLGNNSIFGSALLSSADLRILSGNITVPFVTSEDATAVIYNIGKANAADFRVKFTFKDNLQSETGYEDVSSLAAGSQVSVTHTFIKTPDTPYTVTVVVDSENTVFESNENNNQASRTFTAP